MSKYTWFYGFALVFVVLGMQACKAPQVPTESRLTLPEFYSPDNQDTLSIGAIPIKEFFRDELLLAQIELALKNNRDILQAYARIEASLAQYKNSKAMLYPQLMLQGMAGGERFGEYSMNGVGNFDQNLSENITANPDKIVPENFTPDYFLGFRSSWEIDLWGKFRNLKKARKMEWLASEKGRQLIITQTVQQVAFFYFQIQMLDDKIEIIREDRALNTKALEAVKKLQESGRQTALAVKQFEAQLLRTEALEYHLLQDLAAAQYALNILTGTINQPILRQEDFFKASMMRKETEGIPAQMLRMRPDVAAAEYRLKAAGFDVKAATAAFYPNITLTPFVGLNSFNSEFFFNPASLVYGIFGGITAPIFQQYQLKANQLEKSAKAREALYHYENIVLTAYSEVFTQISAFDNYSKVIDLKTQEVQVLEEAVKMAESLFFNGKATYLDLIISRKEVLIAKIELSEVYNERKLARLNLYKSLGGGWF